MQGKDTEYIQQLIDDYFEGKTGREEDKILFAYFSQREIDPCFQQYQALFASFHQLSLQVQASKKQAYVPHQPTTYSKLSNKSNRRQWIRISSIAASVMLLATISFLLNKHVQNVDYVMIDGIKYTDALSIETAVNNSLANVKIETQDIFSSLDVLELDSLK